MTDSDDFFERVKSKVQQVDAAQTAAREVASTNLEFSEGVIRRLVPMADQYKDKLAQIDIRAKVERYQRALSFTLEYSDGESVGCEIAVERTSNKLEICSLFSEEGKRFRGRTGAVHDKNDWKDEMFEQKLRSVINEAADCAERHGGLVKIKDDE